MATGYYYYILYIMTPTKGLQKLRVNIDINSPQSLDKILNRATDLRFALIMGARFILRLKSEIPDMRIKFTCHNYNEGYDQHPFKSSLKRGLAFRGRGN